MLKKLLMASAAVLSISAIQATQHQSSASSTHSNCPPCPAGSMQAFILIPSGNMGGLPCAQVPATQEHKAEEKHHPTQPHHATTTHEETKSHPPKTHHTPTHTKTHTTEAPTPEKPAATPASTDTKPSLHPELTPAQQAIADRLVGTQGHLYKVLNPKLLNPNYDSKEDMIEFGKPLDDKVYFMHLGVPIGIPKDKVEMRTTGVKGRIEELNKTANKPTPGAKPGTAKAPTKAAKSGSQSGWKFNDATKKWERVGAAGALATEARPNVISPDPRQKTSQANAFQLSQGAANVAQEGITGKKMSDLGVSKPVNASTAETPAAASTGDSAPPPPPPPPTLPSKF